MYYISKAMVPAEMRSLDIQKLALTLVVLSMKLKPYFQVHSVALPTSYPLRQVFQKPEAGSKLIKWLIELGQ